MNQIKVIACETSSPPKELQINFSIKDWMDFLLSKKNSTNHGWFEVFRIEKNFLLYCLENPGNEPFNCMYDDRPIYGNFIITKIDAYGKKIDLSNSEIIYLINKLLTSQTNITN